MSELVEAIYRLVSVVEAGSLLISLLLFFILLFKGSNTNYELRQIKKELEQLNRRVGEGEKG